MTVTNNAAYEIPDFMLGVLEANIDMSVEATYQYTGVDVAAASGSGLIGPAALIAPAASGAAVIGVLQNNPQLAEAGLVMVSGVSKVLCGASFNIGDLLMVDAAGKFITATSGKYAVAKALQAGSSGIVVAALIKNFGKV